MSEPEHHRISKVMVKALRSFQTTGKFCGSQATINALVSMRYVKSAFREATFEYTLTKRGEDLLQNVPDGLTEEKVKVQLPVMSCVSGCGDCCGPVPVTESELQKLRAYIEVHQIVPRYMGHQTCPFFQQGGCQVYSARPLICTLFGHSRKMACPHDRNRFVPEQIIRQMVRANGPAIGTIPEFFPPKTEVTNN